MNALNPVFQIAQASDATLLAEIIRTSHTDVAIQFNLNKRNCPTHPSNCTADWIQTDMEKGIVYFLLLLLKIPIGCVAVETANPHLCYIERLSILPDHRHNGFGTALVDHGLKISKQQGAKKVSIGIIAQFTRLKHWYQQLGFIEQKTLDIEHLPFTVLLLEYPFNKERET